MTLQYVFSGLAIAGSVLGIITAMLSIRASRKAIKERNEKT